MKHLCTAKILFIATLLITFGSHASEITPELRTVESEGNFKPHVGFSAGLGAPESDLASGGNYALEVGYQPMIPLSLALEYSIANYDDEGPSKLVRQSLMVKGAYNFGGRTSIIKHGYVGLAAGPMWEDTSVEDGWALGIMPNIGFDHPVDELLDAPLSMGINTSYLFTSADTPDVFAVTGVVKYWY